MNYGVYRRLRHGVDKQGRPPKSISEDQRLLQRVHLKTIENRTLLETLKHHMSSDKFDEIIVDYTIRLRKAKNNFERHNIGKELDILAYEAELEERDSEITPRR